MKRFTSTRFVATAALALGALGAASVAHARSDVFLSIGVQAPGAYEQPAPFYVHQAPVYVQPAPVYVQPRPNYAYPRTVYVQPQPVFVPGPGYHGNYGYNRYEDNRGWRHHGHGWGHRGPYGDRDRDGVMNRDDRDRDGDGVRNRHDRFPGNPYRY